MRVRPAAADDSCANSVWRPPGARDESKLAAAMCANPKADRRPPGNAGECRLPTAGGTQVRPDWGPPKGYFGDSTRRPLEAYRRIRIGGRRGCSSGPRSTAAAKVKPIRIGCRRGVQATPDWRPCGVLKRIRIGGRQGHLGAFELAAVRRTGATPDWHNTLDGRESTFGQVAPAAAGHRAGSQKDPLRLPIRVGGPPRCLCESDRQPPGLFTRIQIRGHRGCPGESGLAAAGCAEAKPDRRAPGNSAACWLAAVGDTQANPQFRPPGVLKDLPPGGRRETAGNGRRRLLRGIRIS